MPGDRGLPWGLLCSQEGCSLQGHRELGQELGTQASGLVLPNLCPRTTVCLASCWAEERSQPCPCPCPCPWRGCHSLSASRELRAAADIVMGAGPVSGSQEALAGTLSQQ